MDTRRKIVSAASALEKAREWGSRGEPVMWVKGTFDPLLAAHAAQLEERVGAGAHVIALVEEGRDAIVPVAARAELVAALRAVELVVTEGCEPPAGATVHDFVAGDERRSAEFVEHVHERNRP